MLAGSASETFRQWGRRMTRASKDGSIERRTVGVPGCITGLCACAVIPGWVRGSARMAPVTSSGTSTDLEVSIPAAVALKGHVWPPFAWQERG